ncbi:hypothetical protein [Streptomyces sp. UNOC14_S4]|uniref:hypothetical protein n=1 Tax=Streptomyces sp. UNOC14_S4 TaxID=2872340 RepID=UPI001E34915B|nr:hypothetical protein [Streptomyces sp. UNOC14_S4]MCC3768704.1 hypothetical protein [Streptomyces sp. UNOC14_S4]
MQETGSSDVPRAWGLVFGAREVDEPDDQPALFTQFEKDWEGQLDAIGQWVREHGYVNAGHCIWSVLQPTRAAILELPAWLVEHHISRLIVPGPDVRTSMNRSWDAWGAFTTALEAVGIAVETADRDIDGATD